MTANGSSPIRRQRRSKAEMQEIRNAMVKILAAEHPMTVRQVFYRLTSEGVVEKTEAEYKRTVCRLLAEMRRSGEISYAWLADATRWMRKPTTYGSLDQALRNTAATYRRDLWADAPAAVEIWLEKEALAGVLVDVTDEWDVPLMVTRGYPSMSFLHSAATVIGERYATTGQRTFLYYLGDHDPSGVDIDRAVETGIGECLYASAFGCGFTFERIAVTPDQISDWNLPTRPTKKTDSRSKNFSGDSVEVDAIPPAQLRQLATDAIEAHVDSYRLDVLRVAEAEERKVLESIVSTIEEAGDGD